MGVDKLWKLINCPPDCCRVARCKKQPTYDILSVYQWSHSHVQCVTEEQTSWVGNMLKHLVSVMEDDAMELTFVIAKTTDVKHQ